MINPKTPKNRLHSGKKSIESFELILTQKSAFTVPDRRHLPMTCKHLLAEPA